MKVTRSAPSSPEVPVPEPGDVVISYIWYDGDVYMVESDEYAEIVNLRDAPINLDGWRLTAGNRGQDFDFPDFELQPDQRCRIYTDEHHPATCGFSFEHTGGAIWYNKGDCGHLYDATGAEVSRYCYVGED